MMSGRFREMVAILALISLIARVGAKRDLAEFCSDLSRSLAWDPEIKTNPRLAMTQALGQLRTFSNAMKSERVKLANAWEAVAKAQPCDSRSVHHVATISLCAPERFEELASLSEAVRKYTSKCLTPNFWQGQLKKALAGFFGAGERSGLKEFISDQFIEQYRRENPDERKLHLGHVEGEPCCRPWRSHGPLFKALEPIVSVEGPEALEKIMTDDLNKLVSLLDENLFKPCQNYLLNMGGLVDLASYASKYYKDGSEAFVEQMSPEFQNALFRYRYCRAFYNKRSAYHKLATINEHGFWSYIANKHKAQEQ